MKRLFVKAWLFGIAITVSIVVIGLRSPRTAAICDALLSPASKAANVLPGGSMHNPIAIPIGLLMEGFILGVPIAAILFILQRHRISDTPLL